MCLILSSIVGFGSRPLVVAATEGPIASLTENAPAVESSSLEPVSLRVFPPSIATSYDDPARVTAFVTLPDGTERDISNDPALLAVIDDPTIATYVPPLDADAAAPLIAAGASMGNTHLQISWGGFAAEVPVQNIAAERRVPRFSSDVSAVLTKSGCNLGTCHGNLHGKGGFRLSLRGDDPAFDWTSIVEAQQGRRLDRFAVEQSLLLRKPAGLLTHRGGVRLPVASRGFARLQSWIASGAKMDSQETADPTNDSQAIKTSPTRVHRLAVYPEQAWISPSSRTVPLIVVAELADGSSHDVTPWARYEPSVVSGIEVSSEGIVTASRPIDTGISISYLDAKAQTRLVFLQPASAVERAAAMDSSLNEQGHSYASNIDRLIDQRLQRMRITPQPLAPAELVLRRLYLAVAGRLPTADEVRAYEQTPETLKKTFWVERVLNDPGYADRWAMHWSDLLRNEQKVMSPEGAQRWNQWLGQQFADDIPLDQFVRESISTIGSTFEHPAASFHRTHRQPEAAAEALGQVFLGVRIQCARCHNHPFDSWKQDDYYGLAAYFTTIERKQIDNKPRDGLDSHVITGDEIISLNDQRPLVQHPGLSRRVPPKPLDAIGWSNENADRETTLINPLESLAQWLTENNRAFARNMANRIWFHVMGRGIVDPPDDFRSSNPASNPELLEYLTDRLIESDFSTRALVREILLSDSFSRSSISQNPSLDALDGAPVFAGYPLRRMSAEVLLDALSDATGVPSEFNIPEEKNPITMRAVAFSSVPRDGFLRTFGKPDRLLSCECERSADGSLSQALQMLNGEEIRTKISQRPNVIERCRLNEVADEEFVAQIFLSTLSRHPSNEEQTRLVQHLVDNPDRRAAAEDILWALLNSQEFPWIR